MERSYRSWNILFAPCRKPSNWCGEMRILFKRIVHGMKPFVEIATIPSINLETKQQQQPNNQNIAMMHMNTNQNFDYFMVSAPVTTIQRKKLVITEPDDVDILCGKVKTFNKHPGNQVFRATIDSWVGVYQQARTKQEKMKITRQIVCYMRQKYNARFIKPVPGSLYEWQELSDSLARDKVSHALRFAATKVAGGGRMSPVPNSPVPPKQASSSLATTIVPKAQFSSMVPTTNQSRQLLDDNSSDGSDSSSSTEPESCPNSPPVCCPPPPPALLRRRSSGVAWERMLGEAPLMFDDEIDILRDLGFIRM